MIFPSPKKPGVFARLVFLVLMTFIVSAINAQSLRIVQRYDLRRSVNGRFVGLVYGYHLGRWQFGASTPGGGRQVQAFYWTVEESNLDLGRNIKPVEQEFESNFIIGRDMVLTGLDSSEPAPFIRGFPAPPPPLALVGDSWRAPASMVVDPSDKGIWTTIPLLVEYTLKGQASYLGQTVLEVFAQYAVRYRAGFDRSADPSLQRIEGGREATIYLDPITRTPIFIRETVRNEVWTFADGKTIKNEGFILTFYEGSFPGTYIASGSSDLIPGSSTSPPGSSTGPTTTTPGSTTGPGTGIATGPTTVPATVPPTVPPTTPPTGPASNPGLINPPPPGTSTTPTTNPTPGTAVAIIPPGLTPPRNPDGLEPGQREDGDLIISQSIEKTVLDNPDLEVSVRQDNRGIALTLENLRFVADRDQLLPGEESRLESIASILKTLPRDRKFLIVGHTAQIGTVESQQSLSLQRARVIAEALKARGIDPASLLVQGRGGTEPIGDNTTDLGRAKNRRVEIYIL